MVGRPGLTCLASDRRTRHFVRERTVATAQHRVPRLSTTRGRILGRGVWVSPACGIWPPVTAIPETNPYANRHGSVGAMILIIILDYHEKTNHHTRLRGLIQVHYCRWHWGHLRKYNTKVRS